MEPSSHAFTATVLYVDDEELACKYFARIVGANYRVVTTCSADNAMDILEREHRRIRVVVTDFRMPGRDGGDLLREIERTYPEIVLILATAYANKQVLLETINSADVFRILEKPLQGSQLRRTLRQAMQLFVQRHLHHQRIAAMQEAIGLLGRELTPVLTGIADRARQIGMHVTGMSSDERQADDIVSDALILQDHAAYCLDILSSFTRSVREAAIQPASGHGKSAREVVSSLIAAYPMSPLQRAAVRLQVHDDFQIHVLVNCIGLVLASVISNALRAIGDRHDPLLTISILVDSDPQIQIADNGRGIPNGMFHHLLPRKVSRHANEGNGGGLGLVFCHRVMRALNGVLSVDSYEGSGTTVTLRFPPLPVR